MGRHFVVETAVEPKRFLKSMNVRLQQLGDYGLFICVLIIVP